MYYICRELLKIKLMKKIIIALLLPLCTFAQEQYGFSEVFKVPGKNADEIYVMMKSWVAESYRSANHVVQMDDRSSAKIILRPKIKYAPTAINQACYTGWISYTVSIEARDERFKVDVYQFVHEANNQNVSSCTFGLITTSDTYKDSGIGKGTYNRHYRKCKEFLGDHFSDYYNQIEEYIQRADFTDKNDDW